MTGKQALTLQLALFGVTIAYSAWLAPQLPAIVPTHWNMAGEVDGWGSKWVSLAMGPALILFMTGLGRVLPYLSPAEFGVEGFAKTYHYTITLTTGLFAALHFVILHATQNPADDIGAAIMTVILTFFLLLGNVLSRVKRNFWLGIRTPWTLASEEVWNDTHRWAGRAWVVTGIVGIALALAGTHPLVLMALFLATTIASIAYSYLSYRRHQPPNRLAS